MGLITTMFKKSMVILCAVCLSFSAVAYAQWENQENTKTDPEEKRSTVITVDTDFEALTYILQEEPKPQKKGFSHRFFKETKKSFTGWSLLGLTAGLGATGIAYSKDEEVRNWFLKSEHLAGKSKYGEIIGQGYAHVALDFGFFALGKTLNNERMVETSKALAEGLIINAIATNIIKYSVRRKRPNGDSRNSFPSAHASGAFLTATVVSGMYDWDWKVMIPGYLLATFAGVSRLEDDYHWASDVVFGAALGTVIGVAVSSCHKNMPEKLTIAPIAGPYNGIGLTYSW